MGRVPTMWNGLEVPRQAAIDDLAEMLRGDPPSCWAAFAALAERADPSALALLVDQSKSSDAYRRRAAAEAIGQSPIGTSALVRLRALLADPAPIVLRAAADAVGKLRDQVSHDDVCRLLTSRDGSTRMASLRALDALWQDEDFERVLAVAANERDNRVRKQASFVMSHHVAFGWRRLMPLWQHSEIPRERAWACDLIARFGGASDRPLLEAFLNDRDGHVRDRAERAIAALGQR